MKLSILALAAVLLLSGCEAYVTERRPATRHYGYSNYHRGNDYYDDHSYYGNRSYPRSRSTVVVASRPTVYRSGVYGSGYSTRRTNSVYVQPRSSSYHRSSATVVVTDKDKKKKKDEHHH